MSSWSSRVASAVSTLSALTLAVAGLGALGVATAGSASAAASVIAVPTSAAGLGRITTAPDGTMWFVEADANKVGMLQGGRVTREIAFPVRFPGTTTIRDLDVAPDSSVWVLHDQGAAVRHLAADGSTIADGSLGLGNSEFAESVRVAPDGTAWITVTGAQEYVVRISGTTVSRLPNSPECEDALGEAADGSIWCRTRSGLTRLGAGGGGVTYPANNFAAYPYAIAAGPVGSIWFGRYFGGTMFTSPDDGEVGYLDAASGAVTAFDTGERTAPADLVQGPDGAMWFASIGAAKGIGHVSPAGRGALTQVGGYEPTSLTFGPDGAVWFTDEANNVIVRVPTADLQVTNVDPGAGSVFTVGGGSSPVTVKGGKKVRAAGGRVPLTLACTKGTRGGCRGKVVLRTAAPVKVPGRKGAAEVRTLTRPVAVRIKAGKRTAVRPRLSATGARVLRGKPVRATVLVGGVAVGTVTVRR